MSTLTKSLAYDKTIAEMHSTHRLHRRLELGGESPSLRSSGNGILFNDTSSDSDSDASSGSGSYGSIGNRHSFLNYPEENSSPSAMNVGHAFMTSARGSRLLQEEELARLSDVPMDSIAGEGVVDHRISALTMERNIRSPSLVKNKRVEYLANIKNEFITGNTFAHPSTPPPIPPSSPPEEDTWTGKRVHRHSFLNQSSDGLNDDKDKDKLKEKEKEERAKQKKEEKEKLKEEKLRKKQEKKEFKMMKQTKANTDPPNIASAENSKIMQQLLGNSSYTH